MRAHRLFSSKSRPIHEGNYPLHRLARTGDAPDLTGLSTPLPSFRRPEDPESIVNAMAEHQAMLDIIRDGLVNGAVSDIPRDPEERSNHLKAFGYFNDASMVGIGPIRDECWLDAPRRNPEIDDLAEMINTRQTKTLAAGIDQIMADLKDSINAPPREIGHHHTAIVLLWEQFRDPRPDEPGGAWIQDAQAHRGCLLSSEAAVVIANYMRLLGFDARAHTGTSSDICLSKAAVAAGLAWNEDGVATAPWLGDRSELAGLSWKLGRHSNKSAFNRDPYAARDYRDSAMKLGTLKRVDVPTTYMDEANIPRVPKRADMFARSQFGDMGKASQDAATGGYYARKSAPSCAQRRALGAFVLLQGGSGEDSGAPVRDAAWYSDQLKATSYFLGIDAVGMSRCPDWSWYSHDARGDAVTPPHDQAISMVIDQGFETMEGASGDDWISVAQSMRAYLRFSLLGGVVARQIRNLGFAAKAHTVLDGDVLHPPCFFLAASVRSAASAR